LSTALKRWASGLELASDEGSGVLLGTLGPLSFATRGGILASHSEFPSIPRHYSVLEENMKKCSLCIAAVLPIVLPLPVYAQEKVQPVRMGSGLMTFDTVPGWGLVEGRSVLGPTHGAVAIDNSGNIYTSADKGVIVFSPDGKAS
jgi:hypothetical protein